jgi:hypothetical protein
MSSNHKPPNTRLQPTTATRHPPATNPKPDEAVLEAGKDPLKEKQLVDRMRSLLQPFVLRRLKIELKDQLVEKAHVMEEVGLPGRLDSSWGRLGSGTPAAPNTKHQPLDTK